MITYTPVSTPPPYLQRMHGGVGIEAWSLGLGLGSLTPSQSQIAAQIVRAANTYGVPPDLALGIAAHESGFNATATNKNTNGTTDWGVMQLNDTTVQTLGVTDPLDPTQNINAGVQLLAKYLSQYGGDSQKALWAYASGPGAVSSGSMNPTASQFVGYVTGYTPDPSIDLSSSSLPSSSVSSDQVLMQNLDPGQGGDVDWGTIALVAAGALGLMLALGEI